MDNPHYVTPDEAEDLYCPISMGAIEGKDLCAGPKCMAWRWQMYVADLRNAITGDLVQEGKYSTTHGYCGMVRI